MPPAPPGQDRAVAAPQPAGAARAARSAHPAGSASAPAAGGRNVIAHLAGGIPRLAGGRHIGALCAWGAAAALALLAVALAGIAHRGGERFAMPEPAASPQAVVTIEEPSRTQKSDALPHPVGPQQEPPAVRTTTIVPPEPSALPAVKAEMERLATLVSELAADRERLAAEVASLEQQLADVTGSITRRMAKVTADLERKIDSVRPAVDHAYRIPILSPPVGSGLGSDVVFAPEVTASIGDRDHRPAKPAPADMPAPQRQALAEMGEAAVAPETIPATERPVGLVAPESESVQGGAIDTNAPLLVEVPMPRTRVATTSHKADYAVDLGGAFSRQTVADRWADLKTRFASQLRGLRPLVGHVNRFGYAPYRLVVGPLADEAAAKQLCSRLADKISCEPTRFTGDRLAQQ